MAPEVMIPPVMIFRGAHPAMLSLVFPVNPIYKEERSWMDSPRFSFHLNFCGPRRSCFHLVIHPVSTTFSEKKGVQGGCGPVPFASGYCPPGWIWVYLSGASLRWTWNSVCLPMNASRTRNGVHVLLQCNLLLRHPKLLVNFSNSES